MLDDQNRVAIVTGATSGIGRATALALAACGLTVAAVSQQQERAAAVCEVIHSRAGQATPFACDLADAAAVTELVPQVREQLKSIDILVNCAGVMSFGDILTEPLPDWRSILEINLTAPFLLTQASAKAMVEQGRGGRIVNVLSSSAFRARHSPVAYASAKAGLAALTRSAAATLGPHDINVNAVAPGATDTPMARRSFRSRDEFEAAMRDGPVANLLGRVTEAEDVADMIVYLCQPGSRQITGQIIHVSAGAIV